jgi:hypothetical protein
MTPDALPQNKLGEFYREKEKAGTMPAFEDLRETASQYQI